MNPEDQKTTVSGIPQKTFYTPENSGSDQEPSNREKPGGYPFTRGIFPEGYRNQPWMESLASGYGLPEQTNQREKYLAKAGQSGYAGRASINLVFDRPTFCGLDSDHPLAKSEVGEVGVSIDSLMDMERLFKDFPLDRLNVGFIVDRSGPIMLAMYLALADKLKIPWDQLHGIVCNNPLTDFYSSKTPMFPPPDCLRLMVDCIKFCTENVPRFNIARIGGYNTRELGSSAIQEIAFNLTIAKSIVEACLKEGLTTDQFAGKISFQFSQGAYFFEEIAKIRAARRIWARMLKEEFQAELDGTCRMKIHMQTAGSSLTAQEPLNNIARIALQTLSAALSGCQSIHIASFDEALGIPTEESARIAVKTSKIIMHEIGVADVADPLGGSYYVETLTDEIEKRVRDTMKRILDHGGAVKAIENGVFEKEIGDYSFMFQKEVSEGRRTIVGMNQFQEEDEKFDYRVFRPNPEISRTAIERVKRLKKERDQKLAAKCIEQIKDAARNHAPVMPLYIKAAKADVTLGEMIGALEEVLGQFQYSPIIPGSG
ncbi:MAG: methylmalonyl-CoA mutase family protein [Thermodesulfobacteriota bacterium]|nr:methylmalonyl-CoA mutase family protein [Thermodesulfobacteriota bacterium]